MHSAGTVPAFDLRITIEDIEPAIWRQLRVPACLTVHQFHLAVQAVFGWEDRHLYAVRCVDPAGKTRLVVGPDDATEDLDAEPAGAVVLSELLDPLRPGTAVEYEYDFGDGWSHHVELLGPAELQQGELLCRDGANRGPVEDSGGPHGYGRLVQILADQGHPEHPEASRWLYETTGDFGARFDAARFDPLAANRKLQILSLQWWPQPLTDEERDAVLKPVQWLLENAAGDGLELTKDGYLRPATVKRAMEELGWSDPIMGKGNRETHAQPVRELRENLMEWKLVRKLKGRLVLTPRGRRALERPNDLWNYMVDAIARPEHDAVRLVANLYTHWHLSGMTPPWNSVVEVIRDALEATGFVTRSGHPIPEEWAVDINLTVRWKLHCLILFAPKSAPWDHELLTDGGVKFFLEVQGVEQTFRQR